MYFTNWKIQLNWIFLKRTNFNFHYNESTKNIFIIFFTMDLTQDSCSKNLWHIWWWLIEGDDDDELQSGYGVSLTLLCGDVKNDDEAM